MLKSFQKLCSFLQKKQKQPEKTKSEQENEDSSAQKEEKQSNTDSLVTEKDVLRPLKIGKDSTTSTEKDSTEFSAGVENLEETAISATEFSTNSTSDVEKDVETSTSKSWKEDFLHFALFTHFHNLYRKNPKAFRVFAFSLIGILVAFCGYLAYNWQIDRGTYLTENLAIEDKDFGKSGTFYFANAEGLQAKYVAQNLKVEPPVAFHVYSDSKNKLRVQFDMHKNQIYNLSLVNPYSEEVLTFTLNDYFMTAKLTHAQPNAFPIDDRITIEFSDSVDSEKIKPALAIKPHINFEVRTKENIATIIPVTPLEYNKSYTLSIEDTFTSKNGRRLQDGFFTSIRTEVDKRHPLRLTDKQTQIIDADPSIALEVETSSGIQEEIPVQLTLMQYRDPQLFLKQGEQILNAVLEPEHFETLLDEERLVDVGLSTIEIPNPGYGAYIVQISGTNPLTEEEFILRKSVFVTSMSVYMQTSLAQTLVWLNDSRTSQPLKNYTIEFLNLSSDTVVASAKTDSDGVATLSYGTEEDTEEVLQEKNIQIRDASGNLLYADTSRILNYAYPTSSGDLYYSYFYTDRTLYHPNDTVQFWGYLKPYRFNKNPMPSYLEVVLDEEGLNQRKTVSVSADGTFHGSVSIEKIKSAQYDLSVRLPRQGEETEQQKWDARIDNVWIEIKDYQKPLFKINSSIDKIYYNFDEQVTATITPTFYDGTPLPNYELEFSVFDEYYGEPQNTQKIRTDASGIAKVTFPAYQRNLRDRSWKPIYNRYMVRIAQDGENIVHYGQYAYFPSDRMIDGEITTLASGNAQLNFQVHSIDLSALKASPEKFYELVPSGYYYDTSNMNKNTYRMIRGQKQNTTATVNVSCFYYTKRGHKRENLVTHSIPVANGTASLSSILPAEFDPEDYASIEAVIEITDGTQRPISQKLYWYNGRNSWYREGSEEERPTGYSFRVYDQDQKNRLEEYSSYLTYNRAEFDDGENMNFELQKDGETVKNEGKILYTLIQNEIIEKGLTNQNTLHFKQSVAYANSVNVVAAYYDGKQVHPIRDTRLTLNKESIRLTVEATPDREMYRPGEKVTIDVKTTDPKGKGVAANTCVSVVDESIFALQEQYVDTLNELYGDLYFYNTDIRKYTSLLGDLPDLGGIDGGKGSGSDLEFYDTLRKNFKDTAYFAPVRTNAQGYAQVSFTLPDNTTSWRTTTVAVGENLYAGHSKTNFISSMPFFVTPILAPKYLEGDEIAMLVQGHGDALDADSSISYKVTLTGDGVKKTLTAQNKAYQSNALNFGKLPAGEYTIQATAQFAGYRDTVELPLYVISSNLELVVSQTFDPQKPLDLKAVRYPVMLTFYDRAQEPYFKSIRSMLLHYCRDTNQRMARYVAKQSLSKYMKPDEIPQHIRTRNENLAELQNDDGGIGPHKGRVSDPFITTKALLATPNLFNNKWIADYLYGVLDETDDQTLVASCYLGLAAAGEEMTDSIQSMLKQPNLNLQARSYLITGLTYCGKKEQAKKEYETWITPLVRPSNVSGKYLSKGSDEKENDRLTAAAWIAASHLGHSDADAFSLYFGSYKWRIDSLFESIIYIAKYDKTVTPAKFSSQIQGQIRTIELGLAGQYSVALNKSEFASFSLQNVPNNIAAIAYYIGEPSEANLTPSQEIGIEKNIVPIGDDTYEVTLTVRLSYMAPGGYYDISDWVPSNTRLSTISYSQSKDWYYNCEQEGQKLYFQLYVHPDNVAQTIRIPYTIRKVYDSEAILDRTYIVHNESGMHNATQRIPFVPSP